MFGDDDITPASVTSTDDASEETVTPSEGATPSTDGESAEDEADEANEANEADEAGGADDTKEEEEEPEVGNATPVEE